MATRHTSAIRVMFERGKARVNEFDRVQPVRFEVISEEELVAAKRRYPLVKAETALKMYRLDVEEGRGGGDAA